MKKCEKNAYFNRSEKVPSHKDSKKCIWHRKMAKIPYFASRKHVFSQKSRILIAVNFIFSTQSIKSIKTNAGTTKQIYDTKKAIFAVLAILKRKFRVFQKRDFWQNVVGVGKSANSYKHLETVLQAIFRSGWESAKCEKVTFLVKNRFFGSFWHFWQFWKTLLSDNYVYAHKNLKNAVIW
jgi:hypothetical protein